MLQERQAWEKFFHFFFSFLQLPAVCFDEEDECSASCFGVCFTACGISKDDALTLLYSQMRQYAEHFIADYLAASGTVCDAVHRKQRPAAIDMLPVHFSGQIKETETVTKPTQGGNSISTTTTQQSGIASTKNSSTDAISRLFHHSQKSRFAAPVFEFTSAGMLHGCLVKYQALEVSVEPIYKRRTDAKEAVCRYILDNLS